MRLGIYGDSYTGNDKSHSWYRVLANLLQADTCINYGRGGTSVYYSYKKFIETSHNQDLNIFIVTEPSRYTKFIQLTEDKIDLPVSGLSALEGLQSYYKDKLTENDKSTLSRLNNWFIMNDDDFMNDACHALISQIEVIHPNTIFYPAFSNSLSKKQFEKYKIDKDKHVLYQFWIKQLALIGLDSSLTPYYHETENMSGHFGPELNKFFAEVLYKKIETEQWDYSGLENIHLKYPLSFYYRKEGL